MPEQSDVFTIDIHSHFLPPGWLEHVGRHPDAHGVEVSEQPGGHTLRRRDGQGPPSKLLARFSDEALRLTTMDAMGIRQQLLSPPSGVLLYDLDRGPAQAVARLYNETVAEVCKASDGRFLPAATAPMGWPDVAAEELVYAAEQIGARALYLSTTIGGAALDAERFDPVMRAAAETGLPLLLHPTGGLECAHVGDHYLNNILGNPFETGAAAARLIDAGVLDRYPDLQVALVHGGGVLPYLAGRMQHGYDHVPAARVSVEPPRSYLRRFHYDSIVHDAQALRFLAATVGEDRIMIGTDFPYGMGDEGPIVSLERAGMADSEAITAGNAQRFLRL